jgi:GWxTD domain-containing protein
MKKLTLLHRISNLESKLSCFFTKLICFKLLIVAMVCLLFSMAATPLDAKKDSEPFTFQFADNYKSLESHYREWLNMVANIACPEEINTFLQLPTVRDRDLFIRLYWQQRDPSPGSDVNEYRNEIESRFRHVNQYFGRGTSRPGWMTAMGRIYMILGEPNSTESFDNVEEIYPAQVWYYYGDQKLGLPIYFNITFYKPHGTGEWVIYDPAAEGPAALLVNGDQYTSADFRKIYQALQKKAPNLVSPAFSMIPGQTLVNFAPSMHGSQIMSNIYRSPIRSINPAYASNFIKYKGYVNVDSSINFIENTHNLTILRDEFWGYNLITFSVKPKKMTVAFNPSDGHYDFASDMLVTLKQGEKEVYSYRRHYELTVAPTDLDIIKAGGVVVHDSFPAIPGDFILAVFLQNPLSKEFCFFEESVRIPVEAKARLARPFTGFKSENLASNFYCVYKTGNRRLAVDPDQIFSSKDLPLLWLGAYNLDKSLWAKGRLAWEIKSLNERRPFVQKGEKRLADSPYQNNLNTIEKIADAPLAPDYYSLTVNLVAADGRSLDTQHTTFQVSPLTAMARPSEMYNQVLIDSPYYMDYILGQQYQNFGDLEKAAYFFEKSLRVKSDFPEARQALLEILLTQGQYERVRQEADLLPRQGQNAYASYFLKGHALFGLGEYSAALEELLAANKIINTNVNLINLIGRSFLKLGDNRQAAQAFTASLDLNKNQPEIQKLLAEATAPPGEKSK